ncbi:MAG: hypothetical protein WCI73_12405 [Phycisphaerae bacterium]
MTRLGALFRKKRLEKGLRVSQLAKIAWNYRRGCVLIHELEKRGKIADHILRKLAAALCITEAEYLPLLREDEQERLRKWQQWACQPIKSYYVARMMAAIYSDLPLPETVQTLEDAEKFVAHEAAKLRLRCCLVWNRKLSIYFAFDGTIEGYMEAAPGHNPAPTGLRIL